MTTKKKRKKRKVTTGDYVYTKTSEWKEKEGGSMKHFIDENKLRTMVNECINFSKRRTREFKESHRADTKEKIKDIFRNHTVPATDDNKGVLFVLNFNEIAEDILNQLKGRI